MRKYIYHGALSADTIAGDDYVFVDGHEYSLPDDNTKVKRMQRQKLLIPCSESAAQKTVDTTKTTKGAK